MANHTTRTTERDAIFFEEFGRTANVSTAAALAGYSRTSVYEWRRADPEFAKQWENADKVSTENLETALYNRAVFGVTKTEPMMWQGRIIHYKETTDYSDTAAIFLLKARNPEKYRERIEINVNWRAELKQIGVNPEEYLQQMIEQAKAQLEANADILDVTASMNEALEDEHVRSATSEVGETGKSS
jgi:hypothetical protein